MVPLILPDHVIHVYSYDIMCMCTQHAHAYNDYTLSAFKEVDTSTCVYLMASACSSAFLGFTLYSCGAKV